MPADGTPNSQIICTSAMPAATAGNQWINVEIWNPVTGDKDYIYPCCPSTAVVGAVEVEFWCTSAPASWTVTIDGVETKNFTANVLNPGPGLYYVQAWVCADHTVGMVKAGVIATGAEPVWDDALDAGDGRYAGLGHNNDATGVEFDNFAFGELRTAAGQICNGCFCYCQNEPLPKELTAAFTNAINRASCLTGVTFTLTAEWAAGTYTWYGEVIIPAGATGTITEIHFRLRCASGDDNNPAWPGENITLEFEDTSCCPVNLASCGPFQPDAATSTCDPLSLVFGPFTLSCDDLDCNLCFNALTPSLDPALCTPPGTPCCDTLDTNYTGQYFITVTF